MLLAELLAGMGHDVCATAATEAEAVIAATRCRPDLMIVDAGLGRGSDKLRSCEVGRLAILAVNGPAAIEFRCGGTPRDRGSGKRAGNPENVGFQKENIKWPTNP